MHKAAGTGMLARGYTRALQCTVTTAKRGSLSNAISGSASVTTGLCTQRHHPQHKATGGCVQKLIMPSFAIDTLDSVHGTGLSAPSTSFKPPEPRGISQLHELDATHQDARSAAAAARRVQTRLSCSTDAHLLLWARNAWKLNTTMCSWMPRLE
jgi:hypothetical protein